MSKADREFLRHAEGWFVGQLDADELVAFDRLCAAHEARRVYKGAAGFLGLAQVQLFHVSDQPKQETQ